VTRNFIMDVIVIVYAVVFSYFEFVSSESSRLA
jgi:hypothetical protein